ncbi:MAG: KAP family NTPase [Alphaproteobacteria bacterium]|jgi:hypothetical protein|nr:KAP family NTPase [Alphaproteobacteria bacterium]
MDNFKLIKDIESNSYDYKDTLKVSPIVVKIAEIIKNSENGDVFGINADFGVGKTVFCHRLKKYLESDFDNIIYLDIWKDDLSDNPLMPIIYSITNELSTKNDIVNKKLKSIGCALAKTALKAGIGYIEQQANLKIKDTFDKEFNIDGGIDSIIKSLENDDEFKKSEYFRNKKLKDEFKKTLSDFLKDKSILLIVDELDRCRPDFAVHTLEIIKHFFDVNNLKFVISSNKNQLQSAVKCIYGVEDFDGYYRRFVDINFNLPKVDFQNYSNYLFNDIGLKYDKKRVLTFSFKDQFNLKNIDDVLSDTFSYYSNLFNFSARMQKQIFNKLQSFVNSDSEFVFIPEIHLVLLLIYEYNLQMFLDLKEDPSLINRLLDSKISERYGYWRNGLSTIERKNIIYLFQFRELRKNLSEWYLISNLIKPVDSKSALTNINLYQNIFSDKNINYSDDKFFEILRNSFDSIEFIEKVLEN